MRKKVVFDTDIGVDDAMALLFAFFSRRLELVGITTTFGNASIEATTLNAAYVTELFDIDAPIYRGSAVSLSGERCRDFPTHIHGEDGLGSMRRRPPKRGAESESAVDFLVRIVNAHPGEIALITVGRLTNVALALQQDPSIAGKMRELIVMGGALGLRGHGGNVTPVAEANLFGDPEAADLVCRSSAPMTLVGLDVTHETIMSEAFFSELNGSGRAGRFIYDMSRVYTAFHHEQSGVDGCYVHDSSAVAYALEPDLFAVTTGALRVETQGMARGQSIFAPAGRGWVTGHWSGFVEKQVCTEVDSQAVLALFWDSLTGN